MIGLEDRRQMAQGILQAHSAGARMHRACEVPAQCAHAAAQGGFHDLDAARDWAGAFVPIGTTAHIVRAACVTSAPSGQRHAGDLRLGYTTPALHRPGALVTIHPQLDAHWRRHAQPGA